MADELDSDGSTSDINSDVEAPQVDLATEPPPDSDQDPYDLTFLEVYPKPLYKFHYLSMTLEVQAYGGLDRETAWKFLE